MVKRRKNNNKKKKDLNDGGRDEVDYGKVADSFSRDEHEKDEEIDEDESSVSSQKSDSESNSNSDDDDSYASEENSEESEDNTDNDNDEEASLEDEAPKISKNNLISQNSLEKEGCTFDLRNLVAMNTHQILSTLRRSKSGGDKNQNNMEEEQNITIPSTDKLLKLSKTKKSNVNVIDENILLEKASEGCKQLINAIWQLPIDRSDDGPMVTLPSYNEIKLPRSLPPPPPKQETKWEKFAKERGIGLNKEKRSRKVWDEASQTWMYRHGYQKANNDSQEWPIMEVKKNEDPYEDPWERLREAKKQRVDKNIENRMRNQERAGLIPKGTATKTMKNKEKAREAGKVGGQIDKNNVSPSGIPVDLQSRKRSGAETILNAKQRGKDSIQKALIATQRSTASLGKFDQMREGEPERKKLYVPGNSNKKSGSKYESATSKKVTSSEAERGMKLLNHVMNGTGGAAGAREKALARKNGSLAKGETAYDYEYNDGLGASSFKKKKGRAGVGKMKKMTKKRVK